MKLSMTANQKMINKEQSQNKFRQFYGFFPYNSVGFDDSPLLR